MILDEHESAAKPELQDNQADSSGLSYEPTDAERATIKLVEKLFGRAKRWRSQYDKNWMSNYKMFRGQQWREQRPSYRHSEVINLIFQAIQGSVPILTDTRPRWEYQPQEPSDREFSELMNDMAEADWIKNNWLMELTSTVYDAHFYGTGFTELCYNPDAKPMEGDIAFESTDPFACYPDPSAVDVNKKSRFFIKAEPVDIAQVKREYPDLGQYVKADIVDAIRNEKTEFEPAYQLRLPIDETKSMRDGGQNMESLLDQKCLKKTCYMLSDETAMYDTGQVGIDGQPVMEKRLKYPGGRKIVVAGGVLLEDGPLPYEDGKFPFARLLNYMLPREFWGVSEIEQLESPQKIFNKLVSFALDVLTLMGNPIWIVDDQAGVDTDNLINSPGMVVEKNKDGEVRREAGVELQPYVITMIDRMKDWFDGISGLQDQSPPPGVTAAQAISDLQESALTRSRLKTRFIDAYLQSLGQMYLSRVLQYRDVPTVVRLTGDNGAARFFKFYIKSHAYPETDEAGQPHPQAGQPILDERGGPVRSAMVAKMGEQGGFTDFQEIPIKGALDVKVSTGSTMPMMKTKMQTQSLDLFDRGAIDKQALLKAYEYPEADVILQRMADQQQQQAQQAQAAQTQIEMAKAQAKGGGGGMPPPSAPPMQ